LNPSDIYLKTGKTETCSLKKAGRTNVKNRTVFDLRIYRLWISVLPLGYALAFHFLFSCQLVFPRRICSIQSGTNAAFVEKGRTW
ncbi:MAG: hypothetical protein ACKO5C_02525, partial [Ferruginibacter sp.]